jgi:UDP-2,3-diacylglucosamine pyrophosphatase LpxH
MERQKRPIEALVISDVHLGTFGCRAKELLNYLKSVEPKILILNGDIIDIWQFSKRYFPNSHMKVIKYITSLLARGTKVYYITGNHDEMLRKFTGFRLGTFEIVNKVVLDMDGKKAWFFHGDVFDVTMKHSKWLAKLGGIGYDFLIMINTLVNWIYERLGKGRISFSKKVKNSVKGAIKHVNNFETTAADIAIYNKYDYVVCGHIHQPQIKQIENRQGESVTYLNSGDWIENLTSLEYNDGEWTIFDYDQYSQSETDLAVEPELQTASLNGSQLFEELIMEFNSIKPKKAS